MYYQIYNATADGPERKALGAAMWLNGSFLQQTCGKVKLSPEKWRVLLSTLHSAYAQEGAWEAAMNTIANLLDLKIEFVAQTCNDAHVLADGTDAPHAENGEAVLKLFEATKEEVENFPSPFRETLLRAYEATTTEVVSDTEWHCVQCTLINNGSSDCCDACDAVKPKLD